MALWYTRGSYMAKDIDLEALIASVMERHKAGEISLSQAMEVTQALIMASETVGDLEITHEAYDSIRDEDIDDN